MLASACLITEEDIASLRGKASAGNLDIASECISLSTAGFDELPAEAQQLVKSGMEVHLRIFGRLYLAAMHLGFGKRDMMQKACKAVEESMKLLETRLGEIIAS